MILMKTQKTPSKNKRGFLFYTGMVLIILLVIGGLTYRAGQQAKVELQTEFPAPGQLVDVGGFQMHIHCMGEGNPTIILESGAGSFSTDWELIQPEIAETNRVCVYDRAGYGWSERSPQPQSAAEITSALHTLLNNGGIEGPYIMVGHSLGGLYVRLYQKQYPDQLVGIVLVDSAHEEVRIRSSEEFRQTEDAFFTQFNQQVKTFQAINGIGLMALSPSQCPANEKLPADAQAAYCAVLAMDGRFFTTLQEEYELLNVHIEQVREENLGDLGNLPLIVLEAGQLQWTGNEIKVSVLDEHKQLAHTLQQELAALSSQGKLITVEESGHFIQIEQPSILIDAIYQVIEATR